MVTTVEPTNNQFSYRKQIPLFLLSVATLAYEIHLTRIFSITQFYHFAFLIVSLALLGFGASGSALSIYDFRGKNPENVLQGLSLGAWVSIIASYLLINRVPFDSFSIAWDIRQIGYLVIQYVSLSIPFFFNGMAVGYLLSAFPKEVGNVYAVNFGGSALGCVVALLAPTWVGGEGVIVLITSLAASSTILVSLNSDKNTWRLIPPVFSGLFIILGVYALSNSTKILTPLLALRLSPYKSLSYTLQHPEARVISQTWNSYSRVDVVNSPGIRSLPGISLKYFNPPPPEDGLFIDGDHLSPIVLDGSDLSFTDYLPGALAFKLNPNARTLILEPRGGMDVLAALNGGASQVIAIEANDLIISEAPNIYGQSRVEVVHETGRSYLRKQHEKFDIVVFSLAETYHPVRSGAYSLSEDYRYTTEAFQTGMENLTPDGLLVITRWLQIPPSEWLRSFILAVTSLESLVDKPGAHIAAYRGFNTGVLLVKKSPFTDEEMQAMRSFTQERAFDLVYLPDLRPDEVNRFAVLQAPLYYQAFKSYLESKNQAEWLDRYPYDVSPPNDDHPFYGHYFRWNQTGQIIAELGKTWQPFGGAGYFVILVMLALTFILSAVIIVLPLILSQNTGLDFVKLPKGLLMASFAYFGLIGLAFLFIEIPLIQYFILYLGHPAYSLTTVLFTLLLFSGVGSRISHRIRLKHAMLVLVGLILLYLRLLPGLFEVTLAISFWLRIVVTVMALAPLGLLMGMPFPGGIRSIESSASVLVPWVWGINGATSVIASVLAMLLALSSGFRWVLAAGGFCYFVALLLIQRLRVRG